MKKLFLLLLVMPYAYGHEDIPETPTTSGGPYVAVAAFASEGDEEFVAAFPDKSLWWVYGGAGATYSWIDEQEEPRCKEVKTEKAPKRKK